MKSSVLTCADQTALPEVSLGAPALAPLVEWDRLQEERPAVPTVALQAEKENAPARDKDCPEWALGRSDRLSCWSSF
jgi:hypothetical protein